MSEPLFPFRFGEAFDGVAEHGAGHGGGAGGEEGGEGGAVVFADFAEEPADGFVDEVVGMVKEEVGDGEAVGKGRSAWW